MTQNLVAMRKDTANIIADDPWTIVIWREGRTPDDAEITQTFTGRLTPHGARGVPLALTPSGMAGETPVSRYGWVLLAEWDIDDLLTNDEVRATQDSTSIARVFSIFYAAQYGYKWEAICDERQG